MKRIRITNDEFNALQLLADAEKANWFYEDYLKRKTVDVDDLDCLAGDLDLPRAQYMWRHEADCATAQPPLLKGFDGKEYRSAVDLVLSVFSRANVAYNEEEIYG